MAAIVTEQADAADETVVVPAVAAASVPVGAAAAGTLGAAALTAAAATAAVRPAVGDATWPATPPPPPSAAPPPAAPAGPAPLAPAPPSATALALQARTDQLRRRAQDCVDGLTGRQALAAAAAGAAGAVGPYLLFWGAAGLALSRSPLGELSDTGALAALAASAVLGMGVNAPLTADLTGSFRSVGSGTAYLTSSLMMLTITLLLAAVVVVAVRVAHRSVATATRQAPVLGLITGGAFGVGAWFLAQVSRRSEAFDIPWLGPVSGSIGTDSLRAALGGILLGSVVGALAWWYVASDRGAPRLRDAVRRLPGDWSRAASFALTMVVVPVLAGGLIAVIAATYSVATASSKPAAGLIVAAVLAVPNAAVLSGGALLGGSLFASAGLSATSMASASRRYGLITGGLPTSAVIVGVLVLLLMIVLLGVRSGLCSAPRQLSFAVAWRTVALVVASWFVLAALVRITADVGGQGSLSSALVGNILGSSSLGGGIQVTAGLGYPSTIFGSALFATVTLVCGWLLTPHVAGLAPRWAARLAGSGIDPRWLPLLDAAAAQRGQTVSVPVDPAAAAHTPDPVEPVAAGTTEPVAAEPMAAGTAELTPLATSLPTVDPRARLGLLIVAGLLAAGILGLGAKAAYGSFVATPTRAVAGYLDAVAAKDAAGALGRLDPASTRDVDRTLLTSNAMGALPAYTLTEVSTDDDRATIQVSFDGGGPATDLLLSRTDGAFGTPVWRVINGLGSLAVTAGPGVDPASVTINGVPAPAGPYPAFPGRYAATGKGLALTVVKEDASFAGAGARGAVRVGATIPDQYAKAIDTAIKAYVDGCVAKGRADAPGCPFSTYGSYSSLTWRVLDYPDVTATINQSVIRVRSQKDGQVAYTGVSSYGSSSGTDRFSINGVVAWDGKSESPIRYTPGD